MPRTAPRWAGSLSAGGLPTAAVLALLLLSGCGTGERAGPSSIQVASDPASPGRTVLTRTWADGADRRLAPGFHSARDPDLSADGRRVVFVGQRAAGGPEGIHEVDLASGRVRTLCERSGRFHSPRHAAAGNVVFLWNTTNKAPDRRAGVLHVLAPVAGAVPQRITFHRDLDLAPIVAPDGRVVFGVDGRDGLLAVNWDGTEIGSYNEPAGPGGDRPEIPLEPVAWLDGATVLLARSQTGRALFRIPVRNRYYELLPAVAGDAAPAQIPVVSRPATFFQPSILEPQRKVGELFCFDSRQGIRMGPVPTEFREWPRIRVHVFTPASATSLDGQEKLADPEVSLSPDGSFSAWVPADRGLRFELVSRGRVLRTMRRTVWVRPGEKRGCLGCHDRHGLAPPNRVPLALDGPPDKVVEP